MTVTETRKDLVGQRLKRREDPRLVKGAARFMDDIVLPGMAHAAILRSPHAHARIVSIDASAARAMPGVAGVFTGRDMEAINPLPCAFPVGRGFENNINTPRALAIDEVHWTGDGVAVVVAETVAQARDAMDVIQVEYEVLPAVVDAELATGEGAPQLHENAPNNIAFKWNAGDQAGTETALGNGEIVLKQRLRNQRLIPTPLETRGATGDYNAGTDEYTFWLSSQAPHVHRLLLAAFVMGHPEEKIRVITPDLGGGFGAKIFVYPEYPLVGWLSKALNRPVKWTEGRAESHSATTHGRDHVTDIQVAAKRDGKITGLHVKTWANMGGYLSTIAPGVATTLYGRMVSGVYDIPNVYCEIVGTYTNTGMVDAYRGAGRPEATYLVERAIDLVARELKLDPADVRKVNFIAQESFPYTNGLGMLPYDSGNYVPALDKALKNLGYSDLRAEQETLRKQGKHLGIGFSSYVEVCGVAPSAWINAEGWGAALWESANVKVHLTGKVVVTTGALPHGQGHETTFAQIVSDRLGVAYDDIIVEWGDTKGTPFGYGTYGSRSLTVGGTAVVNSVEKIRDKIKKIAAHVLEVAETDIELNDGVASVTGAPDRSLSFAEIALASATGFSLPTGMEPYLDETSYYDPPNCTFPFGTHIAVVEVDADTGKVDLKRYVAVDDVGNVINPLIVDGQVQGGIVQGIGQALYEGAVYDDDGQLVTGTLMDYAIPHASQMVNMELDRTVTVSPVNALGVKGAGEAGTIASAPAVVNAVIDALSPLGIKHIDMPLSAPRVWAAMQEANERN
ncbi:molybdopterin-dependent oxidoreductase [soil metagenome]